MEPSLQPNLTVRLAALAATLLLCACAAPGTGEAPSLTPQIAPSATRTGAAAPTADPAGPPPTASATPAPLADTNADATPLAAPSATLAPLAAPSATAAAPVEPPGAAAVVRPLRLISRGLPVVATSEYYPAALASDDDYSTEWRSRGVPAALTYDLSGVPAEQRRQVLLAWYNGTYGYTTTMGCKGVGYNNLGAYTVEANAAPGGGSPPAEGWVTLTAVEGNTFHSRQHLLALEGYNWLRLNATASDGSPQNEDVALNLDLYDASGGSDDGWIFFGDSITAGAMGHGEATGPDGPVPSFADQIFALTGRAFPPQENAGIPCITTADLEPVFSEWLARFPGRFVAISLGSNDALGTPPETFYARYARMVELILEAGKVPVIPTIPWSPDPERQAATLDLNNQLYRLYRAYPAIVRGPNLWTYFAERPQLISDDQLHPSDLGYGAYRQVWAETMARTIYGAP